MAAPAAPAPILSEAGNTESRFVYVNATDPIVASLPFAGWEPAPAAVAAVPHLQIPTPALARLLVPRCKISRANAADLAAARIKSPMSFSLQDAGWNRLKTEYTASGAFVGVHRHLQDWDKYTRSMTFVTPANMELVAGDWRNTPPAVIPGGAGAAAVAARQAQQLIHFLHLASPVFFEDANDNQPLLLFCMLVGACGPCLNVAGRHYPMGSIQLLAAQLRTQLGVDPNSLDGVLVERLRLTMRSTRLPAVWRGLSIGYDEMRQEVLDGMEYMRSSEGRAAVELRRVMILDNGYVPPTQHGTHLANARRERVRAAARQF